jgi:hypothetical protein
VPSFERADVDALVTIGGAITSIIFSESTSVPNFEIAFVEPEIVAAFVPATDVVSLPYETVPKLGIGTIQLGLGQVEGASSIHSAELRLALAIVVVTLCDFPVVTSFRVAVNLLVVVEYFTAADITSPGETVILVKITIPNG